MDKQKLYLGIFSLVAIIAVFILGLNQSNVLDAAVILEKELLNESQIGCVDDDPLNLFEVKGFVKNKKYKYNDFCGGDKLFQVFCKTSIKATVTRGYVCPYGCAEGVCLPNPRRK